MPDDYRVVANLWQVSGSVEWSGSATGTMRIEDGFGNTLTYHNGWKEAVEDEGGPVRLSWNLPKSVLVIAGGYASEQTDKEIIRGVRTGMLLFGMTATVGDSCVFNGAAPATLVFTETIEELTDTLNSQDPIVAIDAAKFRRRVVVHELFHALGATHIPFADEPMIPHCHKDEANVERCLCVMTGEEEHSDWLRKYKAGKIDGGQFSDHFNNLPCGLCSAHIRQMERGCPWNTLVRHLK